MHAGTPVVWRTRYIPEGAGTPCVWRTRRIGWRDVRVRRTQGVPARLKYLFPWITSPPMTFVYLLLL